VNPASRIFARNYTDWMTRLYKVTTDSGVPTANIRVLMENKTAGAFVNEISQKEKVQSALKRPGRKK